MQAARGTDAQLEAHHGTAGRSLFGGAGGHGFARFMQLWADTELGLEIRELFRPLFKLHQDAASAEYFVRVRYAGAADELAAHIARLGSRDAVDALGVRARAKLQTLESYLAAAPEGGPFLLGATPTHADSQLFGWYCCSQVNAAVVNPLTWHHPDLPLTGRWADAMKQATGLDLSSAWPQKVVPK